MIPQALGEYSVFVVRLINRLEEMIEMEFPSSIPEDLKEKTRKYWERTKDYTEQLLGNIQKRGVLRCAFDDVHHIA